MARRSYSGIAPVTILTAGLASGDLVFSVASGTGYPTGAAGPFFVLLDRGLPSEEKVLVASRSGTSFTIGAGGRGQDGTIASAHNTSASVEHTLTALDLDEANAFVNGGAVSTAGGSTITASGAAVKGLVVKGAASQTTALLEAQNNAGSPVTSLFADGTLRTTLGRFDTNTVPAAVVLVVRGSASQTANLAEFQNSAGTVVFGVRPDGTLALVPSTITTATAGGGAATPSNVALFYSVTLTNGVSYRIPLYNP